MNNKTDTEAPVYSVVIPVYNGSRSLQELCDRTHKVFTRLKKTYEAVLVDDSSVDDSWQVMKAIRENNKNIKIIQLMRNFGQHNALMCGFHHASGKYVITMDDDLQHSPEEIPKLINTITNGYDAVSGALDVKQDTLIKKLGSRLINYLNVSIFNKPKDLRFSSFWILRKPVVNELKLLRTPYPYITGMLLTITRNIGNVTVKHEKRKYGSSTYTFRKLVSLALNLIINYTSLPLRVLTVFGITVSAISFFMGSFFAVKKLVVDYVVPGWTSVVVLVSFFNGILLAILSVTSEYLVRIIGEVSNRQQFTIREKHL